VVSEQLATEIILFINQHTESEQEFALGIEHRTGAATERTLFRAFCGAHSFAVVRQTIDCLEACGFLFRQNVYGFQGHVKSYALRLTDDGKYVASGGGFFLDTQRNLLFGGLDARSIFVARQFNDGDNDLFDYLRDRVLVPCGFSVVDGVARDLGEFRQAIVDKIRRSQFFICLLTKRVTLPNDKYVSSVWLYQETGAAYALGKKPLLLVEDGMDSDYIGKLQDTFEYVMFTRNNHPTVFESVIPKLRNELEANGMCIPDALTAKLAPR